MSFAASTADPGFAPRADVATPALRELAEMDDVEFQRRFGDTPFERPGPRGMRRNARAVLGHRRGVPA